MPDFLSEMAGSSAGRARAALSRFGVRELESRAASAPPPVALDIGGPGFDLIAETKLASPSDGLLLTVTDPVAEARRLGKEFAGSGAAAVSVLTEPSRFSGSLEQLEAVASAVDVPVMRKDFLVHPIQVLEARAAGASGVLVIARLCPPSLLAEMVAAISELGMFALVEVFDRSDLEAASVVFDHGILLGVNTRDLATLEVDHGKLAELAPQLPGRLPAVAESGVASPEDVARVVRLGYRLALVGTSLVTSSDPAEATRRLLEVGRMALTEVAS